MGRILICSCSDERYFRQLEECLLSLEPVLATYDLGIIDLGLSKASKDRVRALSPNALFVVPDWFVKFRGMERTPFYKRGLPARAFIPAMFPGYDGYFYTDADVWFPDPSAVTDYIAAAANTGASFAIEANPAYRVHNKVRMISIAGIDIIYGYKSHLFSNAAKMFGGKVAQNMARLPTLNAGIFFISGSSQIWSAWQEYYARAKLGPNHLSNQTCLHVTISEENLPYTPMPATHNWLPGKGQAAIASQTLQLVDSTFPNPAIKAVHLVGGSFAQKFTLPVLDGKTVTTALNRSAFLKWQKSQRQFPGGSAPAST